MERHTNITHAGGRAEMHEWEAVPIAVPVSPATAWDLGSGTSCMHAQLQLGGPHERPTHGSLSEWWQHEGIGRNCCPSCTPRSY